MAITAKQWAKASTSERAGLQGQAQTARLLRIDSRIKWYGEQVSRGVQMTVSARVKLAAQLVRDKIVANISKPVTKERRKITRGENAGKIRTVVVKGSRSKPGEFPRADTTRLMKDIFWQMESPLSAVVGTSLKYGLILETKRNRSFLVRTFNELHPTITKILLGR